MCRKDLFDQQPSIDLDFPLRNAKRAVEQRLRDSGLVYTILRPSYFMEVWLGPAVGFDAANAKASIYGSGEGTISWISLQDVARFAVESLENPAARESTSRSRTSTARGMTVNGRRRSRARCCSHRTRSPTG